ncbi:hypothetical protein [Caldiplasma sukawensis]
MEREKRIPHLNVNEMAVLLMLARGEKNLAFISRELNMTLQGVRYYVSIFKDMGLINELDVTEKGYEYLYETLGDLRKFLIMGSEIIYKNRNWEAIADEDIKNGDKVYLKMEGGFLHAFKSGPVTGASAIANSDCLKGQCARISQIKGFIDVKFGRINVKIIKNEKLRKYEDVKKTLTEIVKSEKNSNVIFGIGEGIKSLLWDSESVIFFSPVEGSFNAAIRGLDSILFCTEDSFNMYMEKISEEKSKYEDVEISFEYIN